MKFNKFSEKNVLFPKHDEIYIITAGYIAVYDHRKKFNMPDIIAYYTEGDIIGFAEKDNFISTNPDLWFVSLSPVEYIKMSR